MIHFSGCKFTGVKMDYSSKSFGFLRILGAVFVGTILTEALYLALRKINKKESSTGRDKSTSVQTIFFPDPLVACKEHFTRRHGCTNTRCGFSHDPGTSYAQLLRFLQSPRIQIDVCVFVLTCVDLGDILIDLHSKGVIVRVITDGEQIMASGSQANRLRAKGIQVRHNKSSYHMHHKFAIIDGKSLLNGSFNWTRQAITGNHENLLVTDSKDLIHTYQKEFNKLWDMFDPISKKS